MLASDSTATRMLLSHGCLKTVALRIPTTSCRNQSCAQSHADPQVSENLPQAEAPLDGPPT